MHTIIGHRRSSSPLSRISGGWALFAGAPRDVGRNLLDLLLTWQERAAQRHALAAMDTHLLKDLGITRAEALFEARKPFWRG